MTFETWLEEMHSIDHMGYTLRHSEDQKRIVEEWNRENREIVNYK